MFKEAKNMLARATVDVLGEECRHEIPGQNKYPLNARLNQELQFVDQDETMTSYVWVVKVVKSDLRETPSIGHIFHFSERSYRFQSLIKDDDLSVSFIVL